MHFKPDCTAFRADEVQTLIKLEYNILYLSYNCCHIRTEILKSLLVALENQLEEKPNYIATYHHGGK